MTKKVGLLVMSFGTARSLDGIEDYYTRIRQGRKPSPELLQELTERFKMIGFSPLNEITQAQAEELQKQLQAAQSDIDFQLYVGFQYVSPFIGDVVKQMYQDGIREVVAVTMAPHYSRFSVEGYHKIAHEAAAELPEPMTFTDIKEWWKQDKFTQFWAQNIQKELDKIPADQQDQSVVILSAHALPMSLMAIEDTYEHQVQDSADLIIHTAQLKHAVKAWQSEGKGASPEHPWLGPDVQDVTRQLYKEKGYQHFIYCPIGFVVDHLEVAFDNDYECKAVCDELGVTYHRPPMPNADPLFIGSITDAISAKLGF